MHKIALPLALPLMLVTAPSLAEEVFTMVPPDGFVITREADDPFSARSMIEHVPSGQSAFEWTTKVTLQVLPKTRGPAGYTATVAGTFAGGCDGAETSVIGEGVQNGVETSTIFATCPASAQDGGVPVAFMMKAIAGAELTYVAEWAWKGALPDAGQQETAARYLDGAVLCDDATANCPSG